MRVYPFLVAVALALLSAPVCANDMQVIGAAGTIRPMSGENRSIRMVREFIKIEVHENDYDTIVDFVFQNDGPATQVKMGFPESGFGDIGGKPTAVGFRSFETSVDGKRVPAARILTSRPQSYDALWVKTVSFGRNAVRHIQVRYRSPFALTSTGALKQGIFYDFTGGNWKGKVAESAFSITFHVPGVYVTNGELRTGPDNRRAIPMQREGTTLRYTWRNWEAQANFCLAFARTTPNWLAFEPRKLSGLNGSSAVTTVTVPGAAGPVEWFPNGLVRDGVTYVAMYDLGVYLWQWQGWKKGQENAPPIEEDDETNSVTLYGASRKMTVRSGDAMIMVDGKQGGKWSAAPFALPQGKYQANLASRLYVPLTDVMKALGGSAQTFPRENRIACFLPKSSENNIVAQKP